MPLENAHVTVNVKSNNAIVSSPMNYIGGKAKLLPQIQHIFPDLIDTFYDVFAGGLNVTANVHANRFIANDLNHYVIEVAEQFYRRETQEIIDEVYAYIQKYGLSKTNQDAFTAFRAAYNRNPSPIKLYTLICFSFNYQFRFNNNHEYNNPFGRNRSQFSTRLRDKLIRFSSKIKERAIEFYALDFEELLNNHPPTKDDFVYLDPPYLITNGSYNDGNRGFKNWTIKQELALFDAMDKLNDQGVRFALSNVITHKGKKNIGLIRWAQKYQITTLDNHYRNSSHNTKKEDSIEVLITNYR